MELVPSEIEKKGNAKSSKYEEKKKRKARKNQKRSGNRLLPEIEVKRVSKKRVVGHASKGKVRNFPKNRKSKKNQVPNPRTTNPLCSNFHLADDGVVLATNTNNEMIGIGNFRKIRELESPYLNLVPDYLSSRFTVSINMNSCITSNPRYESVFLSKSKELGSPNRNYKWEEIYWKRARNKQWIRQKAGDL